MPRKNPCCEELSIRHKPSMLLLQETKLQEPNNSMVDKIWGRGNCNWRAANSVGNSGGLLRCCCENFFQVKGRQLLIDDLSFSLEHWKVLMSNVVWVTCTPPKDEGERQLFWEELSTSSGQRMYYGVLVGIITWSNVSKKEQAVQRLIDLWFTSVTSLRRLLWWTCLWLVVLLLGATAEIIPLSADLIVS